MTISFNHTIVASHDKRESAEFLAELFSLPSPKPVGHFLAVALEVVGVGEEEAVAVLRAAGMTPGVTRHGCCGRPQISKGLLADARVLASHNAEALYPHVAAGRAAPGHAAGR